MDYILFYNYEDGTREFGYYQDYEEAKNAYEDALKTAKKFCSRAEIGYAEIVDSYKTYIEDL